MKLELQQLKLTNIRTYKNAVFKFQPGTTVIIGENGAGKSTILDSILFSLYNTTKTGLSMIDLVRQGERAAKMVLDFKLDDTKYEVITEISVSEGRDGSLKASTKKMFLKFKEDGSKKNLARGTRGAKNTIYEVLGKIDANLFSNMIYSQQGEIEKIATSRNTERRDLFYNILNLNQYINAANLARDVGKMLNRTIEERNNTLQGLNQRIEENKTVEEELEKLFEQKNLFEKKIKQKQKEYERFEKEYHKLEKLHNELTNLKGQQMALKTQIQKNKERLQQLETELTSILAQKQAPDLSTGKTREWLVQTLQKAENNKKELLSRIQEIENIKKRIEDYHQEISKKARSLDKLTKKFQTLETQLMEKHQLSSPYSPEQKHLLSEEKEKLKEQETVLETKINDGERLQGEFSGTLKTIDQIMKELEKQKRTFQETLARIKKKTGVSALQELENLITNKTKAIEDFQRELLQVTQVSSEKKTMLENLSRELKELQRKRELLLESKEPKCPVCGRSLTEQGKAKLLKEWNNDETSIKNSQALLEQELKRIAREKQALHEKLRAEQEKIQYLEKTRQEFTRLSSLTQVIQEKEKELKRLEAEKEQLQHQLLSFQLDQLREKLQVIREKVKRIEETEDLLIQAIELQKQVRDYRKEIEEKEKNVESLLSLIKDLDIQSLNAQEKQLEQEVRVLYDLRDKLNEYTSNKASLLQNEKELSYKNTRMKEILNEFNQEKFNSVKEKLIITDRERARFEGEYKKITEEMIPEKEILNERFQRDKQELQKLQESLMIMEKALATSSSSREILKKLPEKITRSSLYNISRRASEILQQLLPDRDIVGVKLNEDFSIDIERGGVYEKIARLSGGEKVVIALSLRIALIEEFSDLGLMLWDEPTAALDFDRINKLIDVLEYQRPIAQLIVVTHREEFRKIADQTILIKREPGWSEPVYPDET